MTVLSRGCRPLLDQLQLDILTCLADGETKETTMAKLEISRATVNCELETARSTMGCDTTLQLLAVTTALDWITVEVPDPAPRRID